jgi:esterase/lipase
MSTIHFTSHGYKLAGNIFQAGGQSKQLAFLFIQGWQGHQNTQAAQRLADLGFTSMTYDMRGNRDSEGNLADFSRADFVSDAVHAYDHLKTHLGKDAGIGVVGSSFGSYTAVMLSTKREVCCLSLRVPASYPDEGFDEPQLAHAGSDALHTWREKELSYNENRAFKALHDFSGPVQIIEAGADEVVTRQAPQNYAHALAAKTRLSYSIMRNAPHSLVDDQLQYEYEQLLTAWVKSNQP